MQEQKEVKMGVTGEDVRHRNEGDGLRGLLVAMGDPDLDADSILASEDWKMMTERMACMSRKEGSDEDLAYWAGYEKGLKKEIHGAGLDKWASYIPLAAEKEPNRKFPLIFCLHGAHNPIQLTESYGIVQMAAREECVVIAPENENLDQILSLLEYAKAIFPVDESRVYAMGYSFGGFMSSRTVLARPELFAGVGMGGMLFAGNVKAHELDGQYYEKYELTEEMLQKAEKLEMPALLFMGENEMLRLLPLWKNPEGEVKDGVIPLQSSDKQRALNNWRRVGGCAPTTFLSPEDKGNPVERSIGAHFEKTEVREYYGRKYFIGDSINPKGECLFRVVAAEKMAHWATIKFADLIWEQIGKYARDTKNGKLIRL